MSMEHDIESINNAPRIAASEHALEFWRKPGRTVVGNPRIPVFRMHMLGDYQVPYSLVLGYQEALEKMGQCGCGADCICGNDWPLQLHERRDGGSG